MTDLSSDQLNQISNQHEIHIVNIILSVWLSLIVFGPISTKTGAVILGYLTLWGIYAKGH